MTIYRAVDTPAEARTVCVVGGVGVGGIAVRTWEGGLGIWWPGIAQYFASSLYSKAKRFHKVL